MDHMISIYIVTFFTTNYKKQMVTKVRPVPWFFGKFLIISAQFLRNSKTETSFDKERFPFIGNQNRNNVKKAEPGLRLVFV